MDSSTDFFTDVIMHIGEVQENLEEISSNIKRRGLAHDRSKLDSLEFDIFTSTRTKFKEASYGTPSYQECVDLAKPAVDHHHKNNSHHTDFWQDGINDMSLMDIIEMISDWKAANRRSADQKSFCNTLEFAFKKAKVDPQLQKIIMNTLQELSWI